MKEIDKYFDAYRKNLDLLPDLKDNKVDLVESYKPKTKNLSNDSLPLLLKLGLLSAAAFIIFGIFTYNFWQNLSEAYESFFANILIKLNIIDDKSGLELLNLTDINYVDLNENELAAIGILKKGDTISIITEDLFQPSENIDTDKILDSLKNLPENLNNPDVKISITSNLKYSKKGYDTTQSQLIKRKYNISFYTFNSYTMHYQGWEHDKFSAFSPVSIQSFCKSKARHKISYLAFLHSSPITKEFESGLDTLSKLFTGLHPERSIKSMGVLSRLIPVRIKLFNKSGYKPENKKNTIIETEIVLWYLPTDEFINALPERYSGKLRHELEIIDKIEKGEIQQIDACKEFQDYEPILNICPVYHENLEIKSIAPSPGRDDTQINFMNNKEQYLSIYLFDMNGREAMLVTEKKRYAEGEHNIMVDLRKIENGIYFVVIIDEDGNTISSKFLKE